MKRALLSVWDKTNIIELARFLVKNNFEIISTGGTKRILEKDGIKVTSISSVTGAKEMMNGRVKTLHPKIHAGILHDRQNKKHTTFFLMFFEMYCFHQISYFFIIFDHFSSMIYYFHGYFATWSKYFVSWGKYISCFGVFATTR